MKKFLISVFSVLLIFTFAACGSKKETQNNQSKEPSLYYAYSVKISINPEIELFFNDNNIVIDTKLLNDDAKKDYNSSDFSGLDLNAACKKAVEIAIKNNRINADGKISLDFNKVNNADININSLADSAKAAVNSYLQEQKISAEISLVISDSDYLNNSKNNQSSNISSDNITSNAQTASKNSGSVKNTAPNKNNSAVSSKNTSSKNNNSSAVSSVPVTVNDIYGKYVFKKASPSYGYEYIINFDKAKNMVEYEMKHGISAEEMVKAGEYKTVEEALNDKSLEWFTVNGIKYNPRAGDGNGEAIKQITTSSVTLNGGITIDFKYHQKNKTLTVVSASGQFLMDDMIGQTYTKY